MKAVIRLFLATILSSAPGLAFADDTISDWRGVEVALEEGEVDSNGVAIHYHTVGEGPLVVLIHGIGGLWLDWRHQIPTLAEDYQVVAMTQRGFDKSDQPEGVEHYTSAKVAGDIAALISHFDRDKAIIMAYDSGGFHAWYFAMAYPDMTDRLVTVGAYHPANLVRELALNPDQQQRSTYARNFQEDPNAGAAFTARWSDPNSQPRPGGSPELHRMRTEALRRSSAEAMMNFYKANWPRPPFTLETPAFGGHIADYPKVQSPTLVVFGREDRPLSATGLNDLWQWVEKDLTLLVIPGANHGPHAEVPALTTPRIMSWLRSSDE